MNNVTVTNKPLKFAFFNAQTTIVVHTTSSTITVTKIKREPNEILFKLEFSNVDQSVSINEDIKMNIEKNNIHFYDFSHNSFEFKYLSESVVDCSNTNQKDPSCSISRNSRLTREISNNFSKKYNEYNHIKENRDFDYITKKVKVTEISDNFENIVFIIEDDEGNKMTEGNIFYSPNYPFYKKWSFSFKDDPSNVVSVDFERETLLNIKLFTIYNEYFSVKKRKLNNSDSIVDCSNTNQKDPSFSRSRNKRLSSETSNNYSKKDNEYNHIKENRNFDYITKKVKVTEISDNFENIVFIIEDDEGNKMTEGNIFYPENYPFYKKWSFSFKDDPSNVVSVDFERDTLLNIKLSTIYDKYLENKEQ